MINAVRKGSGKPLLMIHSLGSNLASWRTVWGRLGESRELILIDLPGHGASEAEEDSGTFAGLTRSLDKWLTAEGLGNVDMVGASLGGRLVLEMARRGKAGGVVALDPGGFWAGWERGYIKASLLGSVLLLRGIRPAVPALAHTLPSRSALMVQLSAHPWSLDGDLVEDELRSMTGTRTFDALVEDLAYGRSQEGPSAPGSGRVTIGWGRHDRLCLPVQAERAQAAFPEARLHWFEKSGHFPAWDQPEETVELILSSLG